MSSQLWAIVSSTNRIVKPLKGLKIEQLETVEHKNQVLESFNFLKDKIGPVGATDILHVLIPDLFVPWDMTMIEHFQLDTYDEDYYKFLEICKKEIIDVLTEIQMTPKALRSAFYQRGWKPITKLIDEYHFSRVRKLPPHFN